MTTSSETFDYVVIGSGFGGSVSAMRLTEKGYSVLVLERGKRFRDQDFAKTNWRVWKYLWLPPLRCFGILQITAFRNVLVLHGCGVGGGSLGYANVLMEPDDKLFEAPAWRHLADWKTILKPHYETAKRMLGVARNPKLWPADHVLQGVADTLGRGDSFRPTNVGVFFGPEGEDVPDPFFDGEGPARTGCKHCGGCMVGCRYNAKNTTMKNYLYFAEKWGARIRPECEVTDIRPLPEGQPDGARYEVVYRRPTTLHRLTKSVRARNVQVSAGAIGTLKLLLRCRDVTHSLPNLSQRLGDQVRTNNESLLGSIARGTDTDFSKGVAITSIFHADDVTQAEPVRYPAGSSLMRFLAAPLIEAGPSKLERLGKLLVQFVRHPLDSLKMMVLPGWASRATILLVMQTEDSFMRVRLGRHLTTLFRRGLVSHQDPGQAVPAHIKIAHDIVYAFSDKINGAPAGSVSESLMNTPMTAHIMGGVPFGRDADEGVIGLDCQVFNYPGLSIADNSIIPANPGVNPSLTCTALAEYAMSRVPPKPGHEQRRLP
jgi:cholesterol oxidase